MYFYLLLDTGYSQLESLLGMSSMTFPSVIMISLAQEKAQIGKCPVYKFLQFYEVLQLSVLLQMWSVLFKQSHNGIKENNFHVDICFSLILSFSRAIISLVFQFLCNANVVNGSWNRIFDLWNTTYTLSSPAIMFCRERWRKAAFGSV